MHISLSKLIELFEQGEIQKVRDGIQNYPLKKLQRKDKVVLANLARRIGMYSLGIKLLNPIVRSEYQTIVATEKEKAVYSGLLIRIGAIEEALDLLRSIKDKNLPEYLLFMTHALVGNWDYAASIPLMERYVNLPKLDEKQKNYGLLNLAAAYIHEQNYKNARPLLLELLKTTRKGRQETLRSNVLELLAQWEVGRKNIRSALTVLERVSSTVVSSRSLDALFVKKWTLIARMQSNELTSLCNDIEEVKVLSREIRHFETLRDLDLTIAMKSDNQALVQHLYFGTSSAAFRAHLFRQLSSPANVGESYDWNVKGVRILDLCQDTDEIEGIKGQDLRLLRILCSDFYKPFPLATLFSMLHPECYFDPHSTPARIHQSIASLKRALQQNKFPIEILCENGQYRLELGEELRIRIPRVRVEKKGKDKLAILRSEVHTRAFTSQEASTILGLSKRQVSRLLRNESENRSLLSEGAGKATTYRFVA